MAKISVDDFINEKDKISVDEFIEEKISVDDYLNFDTSGFGLQHGYQLTPQKRDVGELVDVGEGYAQAPIPAEEESIAQREFGGLINTKSPGFVETLLDPSEMAIMILSGGTYGLMKQGFKSGGKAALSAATKEAWQWGTWPYQLSKQAYKGATNFVDEIARGVSAKGIEKTIKKPSPIWQDPTMPSGTTVERAAPFFQELDTMSSKFAEAMKHDEIVMKNWDNIEKWYGDSNMAGVSSKRIQENIRKLVPDEVRRKQLSHAIESPDKFESVITPDEKYVLDGVRGHFEELAELGKKHGIINSTLENYIPHVYRGSQKSKEEMVKWGVNKYIPAYSSLKTKGFFNFHREIATIEKAKELGLTPVEDIADLVAIYENSFKKTLANKKLIDSLKTMKAENGEPLLIGWNKWKNNLDKFGNYVSVDIPALNRFMYVGESAGGTAKLVNMPVKVDPRIAKDLQNVFGYHFSPGRATSAYNAYKNIRGELKRLIMFNPAVHGINIFSDVMAETNLNPLAAYKTIKTGNQLWKEHSMVVDDFVKAGGNLEGLYEFNKNLRDGITRGLSKQAENPLMQFYNTLTNFNDVVLWDKIVKGAQLGTFQLRRDALMKEYGGQFGKELIDKMAAQKVNNLFGTLPHIWLDRFTREAGSIAFFARNWTLSNVNLVANALGKGWGLKGMPIEANRVMQKEYIEHLAKGVFGLVAYANMMNYMTVGHPTWENEKGHWLDIDTGMRRPDGRAIYISPHLFRYIKDYFNWAGEPTETLINKAEPILKAGVENILNYSLYMKDQIVPEGALVDKNLMEQIYEQAKYRVPYLMRSVTPVGRFQATKGHHKTFEDIMIELTGTHERHGLSMQATAWKQLPKPRQAEFLLTLSPEEKELLNVGINIGFIFNDNSYKYKGQRKSVQVATKLKDFVKKYKYETHELDMNIQEKLGDGKFDQAIAMMKEYQRYMDVRGAKEKMLPYMHIKNYLDEK